MDSSPSGSSDPRRSPLKLPVCLLRSAHNHLLPPFLPDCNFLLSGAHPESRSHKPGIHTQILTASFPDSDHIRLHTAVHILLLPALQDECFHPGQRSDLIPLSHKLLSTPMHRCRLCQMSGSHNL